MEHDINYTWQEAFKRPPQISTNSSETNPSVSGAKMLKLQEKTMPRIRSISLHPSISSFHPPNDRFRSSLVVQREPDPVVSLHFVIGTCNQVFFKRKPWSGKGWGDEGCIKMLILIPVDGPEIRFALTS